MRHVPWSVWRLMLAYALMMGGTALTVLIAGIIGLELAPGPGWATLPNALNVVGLAASTLPTGRLLERFGRRPVFLAYGGVAILSALTCASALVAGSVLMYCFGTLLLGWAGAAGPQYRFAALELVPVAQAPQATSVLLLGGILGAFIGPELAVAGRDRPDRLAGLPARLLDLDPGAHPVEDAEQPNPSGVEADALDADGTTGDEQARGDLERGR